MSGRILSSLALAACCALTLACAASDNATNTANASNANRAAATNATATPTPATTAGPASTTTAAAGDKIGVPVCDDYLTKIDDCLTTKVPAAARAQYAADIEQSRKRWRDLAANPRTRAGLPAACKQAIESARTAYKSFGCEF